MAEENDEFSSVPSGLRKKLREKREEEKKPEPAPPAPTPQAAPKEEVPKAPPAQPPWVRTPLEPKQEEKPMPAPPAPTSQAAPKEEKPVVVREEKREPVPTPPEPKGEKKQVPPVAKRHMAPKKEEARVQEVEVPQEASQYEDYYYTEAVQQPKGRGGGKLMYAIALIALISIYFAYTASADVARMKGEMRGIAEDLKVFRAKEAAIRAPLDGKVVLKKELPLSGIFPATLKASGTLIIPLKTTIVAQSTTGGTTYQIPIDQNLSVEFTAPLDFSKTGTGQFILIDEEVELGNEAVIKITARDVWGQELDDIISRLERVS